MDAADTFDVLHVLYERDLVPSWEHDMEIKDAIRTSLYQNVYEKRYKFATSKSAAGTTYGGEVDDDLDSIPDLPELPIESRESKPFIPATNPDDFALLLDPPVN